MILLDSTILIDLLRDKTQTVAAKIEQAIGRDDYCVTRFSEMELLGGAADIMDWNNVERFIARMKMIDASSQTFIGAARIRFELRRQGQTIRNLFDCAIAQVALEHDFLLLHNDRDFEMITTVRPLKHLRLQT